MGITITEESSKSPSPLGSLRPTVAQHTGIGKKVQHSHANIPTYLPPQWSATIHPEGNIYFYRDAGLRVVTSSYLYTPEDGERICAWADEVERQAANIGFVLTDSVELFLELDDDDCNYYFVDRGTKAMFWLEECDTFDLGLPSICSSSHMELVLEAQYWSHVEKFCMHFGGLPQKCIDDLILVMAHAVADNLTSVLSTFPYDAPTCEKLLALLTSSRDHIHDGRTIALVARLWGVITYNRYETHYGQEQSRRSRDSSILVNEDSRFQWDYSMHVDLFSNAHNVSIRDTAINNAGRDIIIHNNTYADPEQSPWNFLSQLTGILSASLKLDSLLGQTAKAHILHAAERIKSALPHVFSTSVGSTTQPKTNLKEKVSEDSTKYAPLNAKALLSKTSMCMPGFVSRTQSVRYSFFDL